MRANFFLLVAVLMLTAIQANASLWFQVVEITPIQMLPNSEANFTVSVKGLGSERAYVNLVFRNVSEGLTIACPSLIKNVFPQGVTQYNCTMRSGDLDPGNYSFVADVVVRGAPSGRMTGYVDIIGERVDMGFEDEEPSELDGIEPGAIEPGAIESEDVEASGEAPEESAALPAQSSESQKGTPAPGAVLGALALLLILWRMKR